MQYIKILLSTALTVFAFMFDRVYDIKKPLLAQFASNDDFAGIVWCALALFIFAFYYTSWERHKSFQKIEAGFAGLFSILLLLGRTFSAYDSLIMIETQKFMTLFAGIGWIIFFYMLLRWIVCFINQQQFAEEAIKTQIHFRLRITLFILLCWLPYIFISLPGNVTYDGMNQLGQWFGYRTPSDFQPWFMTVVFGLLMSIGRIISDNIGIIIIILFQSVFCSWIYSHLCMIVCNYAGKKAMYFTAIFFAIVPIWGNYAATVVKDTLFCAIFVLYFCSFIEIFECDGVVNTKKWIVFGILSLLVCLIRHDGIYRIVLAGLPLFLVLRRGKKQLVMLIGSTVSEADINEDKYAGKNQLVISPKIYVILRQERPEWIDIFKEGRDKDGGIYYYTTEGYTQLVQRLKLGQLRVANKGGSYNGAWGR